jgi:hypothetical protein
VIRDAAHLGSSEYSPIVRAESSIGPSFTSWIDASTEVTFDGEPQDWTSLLEAGRSGSVGFTRVRGSGPVASLDVEHVVRGVVETVDAARARFEILGQKVYVTDTTNILGGGSLDAVKIGNRVSVSGFFAPGGDIVATAISDDSEGGGFLLRGILEISQSGLVVVGPFVIGSSWDWYWDSYEDGDPVLVVGDYTSAGDVSIRSVTSIGGDWGEGEEGVRFLAGIVSQRTSPSDLEVEGRRIDCSFFPCHTMTRARVGTLVGVLQAEEGNRVEELPVTSRRVELAGTVSASDLQNDALAILGFRVQATPATIVTDRDQPHLPRHVADIQIGDEMYAIGGSVGDVLVAGWIGGSSDQSLISTPFATYADPEIHVLGRTILTDPTTRVSEDCVGERDQRWLFEAADDNAIRRLRIGLLPDTDSHPTQALRVFVDTGACSPWDY